MRHANVSFKYMIHKTVTRVHQNDLVRGGMCVNGQKMILWVDASYHAIGVALKVNRGHILVVCNGDIQHS